MSSIKTVAITEYVDEKLSDLNKLSDQILEAAKAYADTKDAELVGTAPETLDTIGELATAFTENKDVVEALDAAITNKQDKSNMTTSISSESTDEQYPSAKAVFDSMDDVIHFETEDTLELPDVSMEVSHDGNGNVVLETTGMEIVNDGNGNISITSDYLFIEDDGNGNITMNI